MQNRLNSIIMRSQENGILKYFEGVSARTCKQPIIEVQSHAASKNIMVATAGGLQEMLIAIIIYFVGISCGVAIFIVECYTKNRISR